MALKSTTKRMSNGLKCQRVSRCAGTGMSHVVQGAKNSVNQTTQATCAKDWRAEITYLTWCADEALMVHYRRSHPRPDPDKMSIL